MSRVLVTGGAGFLGSALCEKLLSLGETVVCLDNLYSGDEANVAHLLGSPGFSFVRHDIRTPYAGSFDLIYNLACPASPRAYQLDPINTAQTCFLGSCNMLELARLNNARILQASTSEIYGNPQVHPQAEDYNGNVDTLSVRSCYDEGKRMAETLFSDYHRIYGLDIVIVRIFNTYGPRMCVDDGRVVSNFIVQALLGRDITIYGDGRQTRSFCYVDDLIGGLIACMNAGPGFAGAINLGNPAEVSIAELAGLILDMTKSKSKLVYMALPEADPVRRQPDISKIRADFGWAPSVTLRDGLKRTIAYFENILRAGPEGSA
jgi:UDP-glucuronate decarboxylase